MEMAQVGLCESLSLPCYTVDVVNPRSATVGIGSGCRERRGEGRKKGEGDGHVQTQKVCSVMNQNSLGSNSTFCCLTYL